MLKDKKDPYEVLGISEDATEDEIKRAWKKAARAFHPDLHPNDPTAADKFQEVNAAYAMIKSGRTQKGDGDDLGGFHFDYDQLMKEMSFSKRKTESQKKPIDGTDISISVDISFQEAYDGCKKVIPLRRDIVCSECEGTGQTSFGTCFQCRGSGVQQNSVKLALTISRGIEDGRVLTIPGKGNVGINGGKSGNLLVKVHVQEDPRFRREGSDLHCTVPVDFTTVALGGVIEVPTPYGSTRIGVPAGTQTGTIFRIRNEGFPRMNNQGFGYLKVQVVVETPKALTHEQTEALKVYRATFH